MRTTHLNSNLTYDISGSGSGSRQKNIIFLYCCNYLMHTPLRSPINQYTSIPFQSLPIHLGNPYYPFIFHIKPSPQALISFRPTSKTCSIYVREPITSHSQNSNNKLTSHPIDISNHTLTKQDHTKSGSPFNLPQIH